MPALSPRHAAALAYARDGIPVFPVEKNGKHPVTPHGYKDATLDIEQINRWWAIDDFNVAVCPEDAGWCVIDLDGNEGIEEWERLSTLYPVPPTYRVRTPSGGYHLYFRGSLPQSARKLGPGIDTRGRGSYVLIQCSTVNGSEYSVENDGEIADVPEWIIDRLMTTDERKVADGDWQEDSDAAVREGRQIIARELKWNGTPTEGAGSDDRAYRLVAKLRERGLSDDKITEMLETLWAPHFDRSWIELKVGNTDKYAQNERGSVAPKDWISLAAYADIASSPMSTIASEEETSASTDGTANSCETASESSFFRSFDAIRDRAYPSIEWVWQDRLLKGRPNLYTGDAGAGKTTLAENIAVAVACGVGSFLGAAVQQMPVILLVGEDDEGQVRDNLAAIARKLDVYDDPGMGDIYVRSTISDPVECGHTLARIDDDGHVDWQPMVKEVARAIQNLGRPCLFVLDPLAEFVRFNNLSPEACRALVMQLCVPLCQMGATVLVNDHPSKSSMSSGDHYAGSTQLKAAFALFATLLAGKWGGIKTRQRELMLSVKKARYAAETDTTFFRTALGPLLLQDGAPGEARSDHARTVYKHIRDRYKSKPREYVQNGKGHTYTPKMMAEDLGMTLKDVEQAIKWLVAKNWIHYVNQDGTGGANRTIPAHYAISEKGGPTDAELLEY